MAITVATTLSTFPSSRCHEAGREHRGTSLFLFLQHQVQLTSRQSLPPSLSTVGEFSVISSYARLFLLLTMPSPASGGSGPPPPSPPPLVRFREYPGGKCSEWDFVPTPFPLFLSIPFLFVIGLPSPFLFHGNAWHFMVCFSFSFSRSPPIHRCTGDFPCRPSFPLFSLFICESVRQSIQSRHLPPPSLSY